MVGSHLGLQAAWMDQCCFQVEHGVVGMKRVMRMKVASE
jgi:hypothetical protein